MAAVYFGLPNNNNTSLSINGTEVSNGGYSFGSGFPVNTSIRIPFLNDLVSAGGLAIVTEVGMQNKETMQYFLTFDDVINYFHFGKGLGSFSISGLMFSDCSNNFIGVDTFNQTIANLRGSTQVITFGSRHFWCVMSSFTIRASAEEGMQNAMEFNLQMEIVNHDYYSNNNYPSC